MMQFTRGLTLVEVIVVVAIVGLLTAIVGPSYIQSRASARDDARKSELKQLQLAVERYYAEYNQYPTAAVSAGAADGNVFYGVTNDGVRYVKAYQDLYVSGVTPGLIESLPRDPRFAAEAGRGFYYRSNGAAYKIIVKDAVESKVVSDYNDEFALCPRDCTGEPGANPECGADPDPDTYAVYSRGAECW